MMLAKCYSLIGTVGTGAVKTVLRIGGELKPIVSFVISETADMKFHTLLLHAEEGDFQYRKSPKNGCIPAWGSRLQSGELAGQWIANESTETVNMRKYRRRGAIGCDNILVHRESSYIIFHHLSCCPEMISSSLNFADIRGNRDHRTCGSALNFFAVGCNDYFFRSSEDNDRREAARRTRKARNNYPTKYGV